MATSPDLVGFSVYLWNRAECSAITGLLKSRNKRISLFCGGPEATAARVEMLAEAPWDFIIAGEGETVLVSVVRLLLDNEPITGVPGVFTRQASGFSYVPAPPITDLETIPSPYLTGILDPAEYPGLLWQISRGCSFACDFCFDPGEHAGVRRFSMERIREELSFFAKSNITQVFVLDSTFNQDRRRAKETLRLIAEIAPHIHFHFEVRSEFLDREQARLFAGITCSIQIGLQSADARVLQNVGRKFNREDFVSRINLLNETGAIFGFDLIYGLPGDNLPGFRKSLDFALALQPNHLDIFPLALLPGTKLARRSRELGMKHLQSPPYTLLSTPDFPAEQMESARRLAAACDLFYSRGKAVAWFGAVVEETGLKPSEFLDRFYGYMEEKGIMNETAQSGLTDEMILQLQQGFLKQVYTGRKLKRLLPLALDLVEYNYHYAAALMAVPPAPLDENLPKEADIWNLPLKLAESSRLAAFSYEILEILEDGVPDLSHFASVFSPSSSFAVIYPRQGEVFTESLFEPYFRLLQRLDGATPVGTIVEGFRLNRGETIQFLEFALAEGIAVTA